MSGADKLSSLQAVQFAFSLRIFYALSLVVIMFTLTEGDVEFGYTFLVDEEPQGDDGLTRVLHGSLELAEFFLLQQQLAVTTRSMVRVGAKAILADVHLLDPQFAFVEEAVCIHEAGFALADRLDLRATQAEAGRIAVEDLVVERRTTVLDIYIALGYHLFLTGSTRNYPWHP